MLDKENFAPKIEFRTEKQKAIQALINGIGDLIDQAQSSGLTRDEIRATIGSQVAMKIPYPKKTIK